MGSPQYAASEIAADEIAAKNWPPMQKADILKRQFPKAVLLEIFILYSAVKEF